MAEVWRANPDVILLMPCGFDVRRTVKESTPLRGLEGWNDLPAVKAGNVYALNGNAYFSRPGPRLVNGLEILARIIHPEQITENLLSVGCREIKLVRFRANARNLLPCTIRNERKPNYYPFIPPAKVDRQNLQ